jgi:hypothetical protein
MPTWYLAAQRYLRIRGTTWADSSPEARGPGWADPQAAGRRRSLYQAASRPQARARALHNPPKESRVAGVLLRELDPPPASRLDVCICVRHFWEKRRTALELQETQCFLGCGGSQVEVAPAFPPVASCVTVSGGEHLLAA